MFQLTYARLSHVLKLAVAIFQLMLFAVRHEPRLELLVRDVDCQGAPSLKLVAEHYSDTTFRLLG